MSHDNSSKSSAASRASFIAVAAILLAAAIVLNAAVQNFKLHFKKEAVAQPHDFQTLPPVMGKWLQISEDDKLDKELQDVLGTDRYVYRDYLLVDQAGADLLTFLAQGRDKTGASTQPVFNDDFLISAAANVRDQFASASPEARRKMITDALAGKTANQRKEIAYAVEVKDPGSVLHLGLTYYTGLVDTVAHIPDRCYIADGFDVKDYIQPTWMLGKDPSGKDQAPLEVRFISFQDQTGQNRVPKCVAYVFNVNGQYASNPLAVRQSLEDLTQRYGYYAKIEMMTIGDDTDLAQRSMADFLASAKGQIDTCFPDWKQVVRSHQ